MAKALKEAKRTAASADRQAVAAETHLKGVEAEFRRSQEDRVQLEQESGRLRDQLMVVGLQMEELRKKAKRAGDKDALVGRSAPRPNLSQPEEGSNNRAEKRPHPAPKGGDQPERRLPHHEGPSSLQLDLPLLGPIPSNSTGEQRCLLWVERA